MTKQQYIERLRKLEGRQLKQEFIERIIDSGIHGVRINRKVFMAELERRLAIRLQERKVIERLAKLDS